MTQQWQFDADLWLWDARREDTWTFVTLPPEVSVDVEDAALAAGPRRGFGSVPVEVSVGGSTWRTAVFPDKESGCFVLPIKKPVRRSEGLAPGDSLSVRLRVLT